MNSVLVFVVSFASCVPLALALPGGAPASVCESLTPGHGAAVQPNPSSYMIDLSDFMMPNGSSGYYYTPGYTYTITLMGTGGATFRGFLIQGRSSDMGMGITYLGSFQDPAPSNANARLSSCPRPEDGVTHVNPQRLDFSYMMFNWTAPVADSGPLQFYYTTVQVFDTYWVAEKSPVIQEVGAATPDPAATTGMPPDPAATTAPTDAMTTENNMAGSAMLNFSIGFSFLFTMMGALLAVFGFLQ